MLDGEQPEQHRVDDQTFEERARHARVDRLRDDEIADKANGIEQGDEKDAVRADAVEDRKKAGHCCS